MTFAPTYDLMDNKTNPNDKQPSPIQVLMLKLAMLRKSNMKPNPADGFLTTNTHADSDAQGAGDATTSPGATPGQQ